MCYLVPQARNLGSIPDSSSVPPASLIQATNRFAHSCCLNTSQLPLSPWIPALMLPLPAFNPPFYLPPGSMCCCRSLCPSSLCSGCPSAWNAFLSSLPASCLLHIL